MKVLLISANTESINMPTIPMGLGCVAEALSLFGHQIQLLDLLLEKDPEGSTASALRSFEPDAIGLSIRNIDDQNSREPRFLLQKAIGVVDVCRRWSKAPIILGGPGYSIFPESCLAYLKADFGIRGEGESAFPELLAALAEGRDPSTIPGLFIRGKKGGRQRQRIRRLDRYPVPDPKWFSAPAYRAPAFWLPWQTRRGCPMDCSYCSTAAVEGRSIRRRSVDAAVRGIDKWAQAGFRQVFFVDNTFNLPPSYARGLCRELVRLDLPPTWRCILYPGSVTEELVRDMSRAGCAEVSFGLESGDPRVLKHMNKRYGLQDIGRSAALLADHGIRRMGFLLLGGPGETRRSVEKSLSFVDELGLDSVKITVGIRIYPETHVEREAREKGLLDSGDDLLFPRFYIEPDLKDWLFETAEQWIAERPNWFF